jgi:DNA gyrase subunit A
MIENKKIKIGDVSIDVLEDVFMEAIEKDFGQLKNIDAYEYAVKSYLLYSASVVAGRAIPDLRDGFKHGQRRALFIMKDMGISSTGSYKKSARITGAIIGRVHPHGDTAAYETLVNMVQPWKKNLPLADGQGNWGSIDDWTDFAAARYTEIRLTKASEFIFKDLKLGTVSFIDNYDGTEKEPEILPVPFPNILINGVPQGSIAVGMSSSILPHNSKELMDLMIKMMRNRKNGKTTTAEEFLSFVPAPDFPTGGYVYDTKNMLGVIKNGRGTVRLRAKHHIEELTRGKKLIVITEIPWGKKKTKLIESIADLKRNDENKLASAIIRVNDESDKNGLRIVIEVKAGFDIDTVFSYILHKTELDTSHSYVCVVLDQVENSKGEMKSTPREYGLLEIMERFVDFRYETFTRKHQFLIQKYGDRLHILDGLIRAIDMIDEIIALIKQSSNQDEAKEKLVNLKFSLIQAEAIVAMRLGRITKLPKQDFLEERTKLKELISYSEKVLEDFKFQTDELIKESKEVLKGISFERKSEIKNDFVRSGEVENVTLKEDCHIYISKKGYVKRVSGKNIEKKTIELTDDDIIVEKFETDTHSYILFIMESGHIFAKRASDIPDSDKGSYFGSLFENESKLVKCLCVSSFEDKNILFTMSDGLVKSSSLDLYNGALRNSGVKGVNLKNGIVVSVDIIDKDTTSEIIIFTKEAKCIKFDISEISVTGRSSSGVKGISLKGDNKVIGSLILDSDFKVLFTTENGVTKLVASKDFKKQKRAGVGVNAFVLTKKSGAIISIERVS